MACGDRRKYLTALITLNEQELIEFAGRKTIEERDPGVLAGHPAVFRVVDEHVQAVNRRLAPHEQIRRFTILPRDFTEEAGELTPTLKIRRQEIVRRYGNEIELLYSPKGGESGR